MDINIMGITSVAGITVICYLLALCIKQTPLANKWLPTLCGLMGGLLGVAGMYTMPEFPAGDVITALAVGLGSGLAAPGADQIAQQLHKG